MVFYVYLKHASLTSTNRADYGRHILTFESRYVGDEFYRSIKGAKANNGNPRYTTLKRQTPHFWTYDSSESDPAAIIVDILRQNTFPEFNFKVMSSPLTDTTTGSYNYGRSWPIIHPVDGPDWLNGGTFFIRNKRQPHLYWSAVKGNGRNPQLVVSTSAPAKFRIRGVDLDSKDNDAVLNRRDNVTVNLLGWESQRTFYLAQNEEDDVLILSNRKTTWRFGDFFQKFGVLYDQDDPANGRHRAIVSEDLGDEWELC